MVERNTEPVIIAAQRTPVGRGHPEKGAYRGLHPSTLLAGVLGAVVERSGIDAGEIEDVLAGCGNQFGVQGRNIARNAALEAGYPVTVPGLTLDRQCGSAQEAVNIGASLIASGARQLVAAGGVEHMGKISFAAGVQAAETFGDPFSAPLRERYEITDMGIAGELIAEQWQLSRQELDELAVRSHSLAARATDEGRFEREIAPVRVGDAVITVDEGIRRDSTLERVAAMRPAFKSDGVLTAATSSQISDGAAALLLASRAKAEELGVRPRARIVDHVAVGVDPVLNLTGPIPATQQILARNGMGIDDVDLIEVNEAFASVVAAWAREVKPDMDRVNVNGGAMALGHPLGSTGARLITTLLHELERTDGELGLVTMCCAGGLGTATLVQRI